MQKVTGISVNSYQSSVNNLYPVSHITFNLLLNTYYSLKGNKGNSFLAFVPFVIPFVYLVVENSLPQGAQRFTQRTLYKR